MGRTLPDILKDMNFTPSRADQCIWFKKNINLNLYEYIAVYVDDLCIAAQNPKEIINILKSKQKLKVKEMVHNLIIWELIIIIIQMAQWYLNLRSTLKN